RREIPALQSYRNLQFHGANNDRVLFYSKATPDRSSLVLVAVSLDPYAPQEAILALPLERLGIPEDETYQVHDVLSGERALWQGASALVQLTPEKPAAVWSVLRFRRSEQGFDYYFWEAGMLDLGALPEWLQRQRWFGGKGAQIASVRIVDEARLEGLHVAT